MRCLIATPLILALVAAAPMLNGCEETVDQEKSVDVKDDGTVVTEEEKVTETPSGDVTKTQTKEVDKPGD